MLPISFIIIVHLFYPPTLTCSLSVNADIITYSLQVDQPKKTDIGRASYLHVPASMHFFWSCRKHSHTASNYHVMFVMSWIFTGQYYSYIQPWVLTKKTVLCPSVCLLASLTHHCWESKQHLGSLSVSDLAAHMDVTQLQLAVKGTASGALIVKVTTKKATAICLFCCCCCYISLYHKQWSPSWQFVMIRNIARCIVCLLVNRSWRLSWKKCA